MGAAALLAAPAVLRSRPAYAVGRRIEVEGSRFSYEGRPLRLTGVAMGDPVYVRAKRPLRDYDVLASDWLANCVRISVHPGHWRNERGTTERLLARDVQRARSLGLFVILCWHRVGFPGLHDFVPPAEWGFAPDAFLGDVDDARRFWSAMAQAYGDDPGILLELWNEPVADPLLWEATGQHWPVFKPAWETLIAEIRRHSDAVVLATGSFWAHDLVGIAEAPLADPRTAYAWHAYPAPARHGHDALRAALGGLDKLKPIVVTEWGWTDGTHENLAGTEEGYGVPFIRDTLDALALSWTAWCYSVGAVPNLLADEAGMPSAYGAFVRAELRRAAGARQWALAR